MKRLSFSRISPINDTTSYTASWLRGRPIEETPRWRARCAFAIRMSLPALFPMPFGTVTTR